MIAFVLLHGFTGAPASWDRVVASLPRHARVARPALSGHGAARIANGPGWQAEVERLLAYLDGEGIDRAHLVGYSMGGRLAWSLLAAAPARFVAATLIGAHPGLRDPAARARRRDEDEARARHLERDGIDAFIDDWAALPMWASQAALAPDVLDEQDRIRRAHDPAGLAHALRTLGLAEMPAVDPALVRAPVRLVVGERDAKHVDLARSIATELSRATVSIVENAGHNVVLERPDAIAALLSGASGMELRA